MNDINNVVVIGTGLMGSGIAQISLMAGYNVTIVDINDEIVDKAYNQIKSGLVKLEGKGQLGNASSVELLGKLNKSLDVASAVKDADFVLEAVVEIMDIKKKIFKTCDENSPSHCLLASNTSSMSITEIASAASREDQVIGMHFFNPPILMRLVEIIAGKKTSEESMKLGVRIAQNLPCIRGERYVAECLKDRPGFIVNRINAPVGIYSNYIFDLAYEKGIPWGQLDADVESVMPMGPCELADYTGLDLRIPISEYYSKTLSQDFGVAKVITKMVNEGKTGRKSGQGFYDWTQGRPKIDKSVKAGLYDLEMRTAIMLNEGCRLLEEGVVKGYQVIDDANMAGMNVPGPFSEGVEKYQKFSNMLEDFADKSGKTYLKPCRLMKSGEFVKMRN